MGTGTNLCMFILVERWNSPVISCNTKSFDPLYVLIAGGILKSISRHKWAIYAIKSLCSEFYLCAKRHL